MSVFLAVVRFNYRRMMRGWMVWFVTALIVGAVCVGAILLRHLPLEQLATGPASDNSRTVGYVVLFATYIFTLLCGNVITGSVALEATSRVRDLLVHRVSPRRLVFGKITALMLVVAQSVLIGLVSVGVLTAIGVVQWGAVRRLLGVLHLGAAELCTVGVCMLVAMLIYTLLYAIVGILITDEAQLQFAQLPVSLVLLGSFIASFLGLSDPEGSIAHVAALIPTSAPFVVGTLLLAGVASPLTVAVAALETGLLIAIINVVIVRVLLPRNRRNGSGLSVSVHEQSLPATAALDDGAGVPISRVLTSKSSATMIREG